MGRRLQLFSRAIILKNYPATYPTEKDAQLVRIALGDCSSNKLVIRTLFLSVDPYMRNRMRPEGTQYSTPFKLHEPIVSMGIGEVVTSETANFRAGDLVIGMMPWQDFSVIDAMHVTPIMKTDLPISAQLSILGYPGLTAYVGMCHIAKPTPGQTVFISSAAGAVGSLAGQLAKIEGCHVVGCTGTDEKVDYLINDLGYDAAFNYHLYQNNYRAVLQKHAPQGIDINFENVGGRLLESVIEFLNLNSIIILCGMISQYNTINPRRGPSNFSNLPSKNAKLIGFIVTEYDHLMAEFQQQMITHYKNGNILYRETIVDGLDNAWKAFLDLFEGKNIGKMLIAL